MLCSFCRCRSTASWFLLVFAYNNYIKVTTTRNNYLDRSQSFITADKILISIHRIAMIIWTIKIIRIAGIIFTKRSCLSYKILQRVGMIATVSANLIYPLRGNFLYPFAIGWIKQYSNFEDLVSSFSMTKVFFFVARETLTTNLLQD